MFFMEYIKMGYSGEGNFIGICFVFVSWKLDND